MDKTDFQIGVLGARSSVGHYLIQHLLKSKKSFICFSRKSANEMASNFQGDHIPWANFETIAADTKIETLISVAPIWSLVDYFSLFEKLGVRRLVVVSSTSRFTKSQSSSEAEKQISRKLILGEEQLQAWAEKQGVEWIVLRPTLIYDGVHDKNVAEIVSFIRRYKFFPVFGAAAGRRQPIHCEDVALASLQVLNSGCVKNKAYNITGGETLTYREMVSQVFAALGRRAFFVRIPLSVFNFGISLLRRIPRYSQWTTAMAERMNMDLVFDSDEARQDFGFSPRPFTLPNLQN